jgi:hypothetical protein
MTKMNTIIAFASAVVVAMTAIDSTSATYVRRLDHENSGSADLDDENSGSADLDHWVGSGDDTEDRSSSDSMDSDELLDEEYTVPKYGQCGGIGYFGNFMCSRGYVCVISHPWFAQCLPADATEQSWGKKKKASHPSKLLLADYELLVDEASAASDDADVVPAWEQCGGKGNDFDFTSDDSLPDDETPKKECEEGYTCEIVNEWYYQCQPLPDLTGLKLWEQCGGEDYMGPTECTTGSVCKSFNDWYSQCVPAEQEFS